MKLNINGKIENYNLKKDMITVDDLLSLIIKQTSLDVFAIAVNEEFVAKSQYKNKILNELDRIEIITPHPGG